jgi:thiol-disulfide isomerase/thioredoxin
MKFQFGCIILLLSACIACSTPESSTLTVKFKNKKYDQLFIEMTTDGNVYKRIDGVSADGATWSFTIPDSLLSRQQHAELFTEWSDTLVAPLGFSWKNGSDTIRFVSSRIKKGDVFELEYLHTSYEENSIFWRGRDERKDEFMITGSVDFDTYQSLKTFVLFKQGEFASIMGLIKKHPSSVTLMCSLYDFVSRFEKEQLRELYNCFDASAQQSYWGGKISELLLMPILNNPTLRNLVENTQESMITDSTKYNMVIFSASWCGWCHEQIPLLKQVYSDLHEKGLEMAYITVDEEKDLEAWNKVMKEYAVPWRSLWGGKDTKLITYKFGITAYPRAILFCPDGTSEKIDVRKEPDKEKLYGLLNGEDKS